MSQKESNWFDRNYREIILAIFILTIAAVIVKAIIDYNAPYKFKVIERDAIYNTIKISSTDKSMPIFEKFETRTEDACEYYIQIMPFPASVCTFNVTKAMYDQYQKGEEFPYISITLYSTLAEDPTAYVNDCCCKKTFRILRGDPYDSYIDDFVDKIDSEQKQNFSSLVVKRQKDVINVLPLVFYLFIFSLSCALSCFCHRFPSK